MMLKFLRGGYVARLDNTKIYRKPVLAFKLSKELKEVLKLRKLLLVAKKNLSEIYDADKAKYYRDMLNFYNNNAFGYGISGTLTHYDPSKVEDLLKIQSNFDYAKSNVKNLGETLITTGVGGSFKGLLPAVSRRRTVGLLSSLTPYKIGEGAEAIVIKNSPTTVGKITLVGSGEMLKRNTIPNSMPLKFVGYVRDGSRRFPTFLLKKVKVLTERTFPKYVDKLDKAMLKKGFRKVNDPDVQYRAYTDGNVVIDDVAPGNVGLNFFRLPKLIDFNMESVPNWLELGFSLKHGGKLIY